MTVPIAPPWAWALGFPHQRAAPFGGLPAFLWADSVLPWSRPDPLTVDDPPLIPRIVDGGWWGDLPSPPPDTISPGEFEGWHRMFAAGARGARVFPSDRVFNILLLSTGGLKNSDNAPLRFNNAKKPVPAGSDDYWITQGPDLASRFLRYYLTYLRAPETYVIPQIPERDIMNFLEVPGPPGSDPPDRSEGERAIRKFIRDALDPTQDSDNPPTTGAPARVIGWYLFDEPNELRMIHWRIRGKVRGQAGFKSIAQGLREVRDFINKEERLVRLEWGLPYRPPYCDPPNFDHPFCNLNGPAEWLCPVLLTFSARSFKIDESDPEFEDFQPRSYRMASTADMYMFDYYPYRRPRVPGEFGSTIPSVWDDYPETNASPLRHCCLSMDAYLEEGNLEPDDPARTQFYFQKLYADLNPPVEVVDPPSSRPRLPGDPGYLPVFNWIQVAGYPGPEEGATPSKDAEPGPPLDDPDCDEDCPMNWQDHSEWPPSPGRRYRRPQQDANDPLQDEIRVQTLMSIFGLSEGMPCFSLAGTSDQRFLDDFVPVVREVAYFSRLRWTYVWRRGEVTPAPRELVAPVVTDGRTSLRPQIFFLD